MSTALLHPFARQLEEIIDRPDIAAALGLLAHERATAIYGWDAITDGYEAWLEGLVGR